MRPRGRGRSVVAFQLPHRVQAPMVLAPPLTHSLPRASPLSPAHQPTPRPNLHIEKQTHKYPAERNQNYSSSSHQARHTELCAHTPGHMSRQEGSSNEATHKKETAASKEGDLHPTTDDYYVKPICPPGGHGRGHRLALQNRAAARHVPLTVNERGAPKRTKDQRHQTVCLTPRSYAPACFLCTRPRRQRSALCARCGVRCQS